jgi:hypothetical protein
MYGPTAQHAKYPDQEVMICQSCGYVETDMGVIGAAKLTTKQLADIAKDTEDS